MSANDDWCAIYIKSNAGEIVFAIELSYKTKSVAFIRGDETFKTV